MVKGDNEYWGRWNEFQQTGKFPKRNRNTSSQIPDAELNKRLEGKDIPEDEWGNDMPISITDPTTGDRQGLSAQIECPHCGVRKHTQSRIDSHVSAAHPDTFDLPGKKDGMIF